MGEDFKEALVTGIEGKTFCILTKQNLDKNYFPQQAKNYFETMTDIKKPKAYTPFIDRLRELLKDGITEEELREYFNDNINKVDIGKINFITKSISNTKHYEKSIKAKENSRTFIYKNEFPKNN